MARWLDSHPEIQLSAVKEPNFFSAHEFDPAQVAASHLNDVDPTAFVADPARRTAQFAVFREKAQYQALFQPMKTPWRMEASTSYLACPEAPALIHAFAPDARIILLTRDPLARALSHYRLARRTGRTTRPLAEDLRAELSGHTPLSERFLLRPSQQDAGLQRFRGVFPPEQCLFLKFEKMIESPETVLTDVARWLGVAEQGFDLTVSARNAGVAPRFPRLNRHLQQSGLKTRLRRALPQSVKARLKPVWFDASNPIPIPAPDRAALAKALAQPCPTSLPAKDLLP